MSTWAHTRALWARLGRLEKCCILLLALFLALQWTGVALLLRLLVLIVLTGAGGLLLMRTGRQLLGKLLWRLRNRLLVAYFFVAVVPIVLIVALAATSAQYFTGQLAAYLVSSELDRRVGSLRNFCLAVAQAPEAERARFLARIAPYYNRRFPGIEILAGRQAELRYPPQSSLTHPGGWGESQGLVVRDGLLYVWAHCREQDVEVTALAPLTRSALAGLAPGIGEISVVHFPGASGEGKAERRTMRLHEAAAGQEELDTGLPPPVNRFDYDLLWGTTVPVAVWESPAASESALLAVHTRYSAVLAVIFARNTESGLLPVLYGLAILILIAEIISLVIGISITKSITAAIHDLYEGTVRVMQGDFTHRIEVRGKEQIAELSRSFNRMTENIQHLLAVAKEKERMQAELQIAQEVQAQLFPRTVPKLNTLEMKAFCNPARMVSGDYYDYQELADSKIALAIGDIAGKGISAALLMATLQSSLRVQVRECLERAAVAGQGGGNGLVSTSGLVSRLNQQLYADTSPEKYATFFFGVYDDRTGMFHYTNAGHLPPLLLRNGEVTALDVNGMVVGAFPFASYGESRLQLEAGDLLVCYTDGVTEPENEYGEMFGEQRLKEVLCRMEGEPASAVVDAITEAVRAFTGSPELQDDLTLLVARRL